MSEEEKQAIEKFSNLMTKHFEEEKIDTIDYLDYFEGITILNLIDKQQKEIEKYKNRYKEESELNIQALNTLKECVHKDKIREKIKEYEELVNEFEEYWSKDPRQFKKEKSIDYYKIEALNELLGETND